MEKAVRMILEDPTGITVEARIEESPLAMTAEEFFERYVRPAFAQLLLEKVRALDADGGPINHNFKDGALGWQS